MKILILYSGGLDSMVMKRLADVEYPEAEVHCVYYAHGAISEKQEIASLSDSVEVRTVDWLTYDKNAVKKEGDDLHGSIYIPGRNLALFTLGACQYLPDQIWMGTLYDECHEGATDKNEHFRKEASELASYVLSPFLDRVELVYPFVDRKWYKTDMLEWALNNGVRKEDVLKTTSCWFNTSIPCGECHHCFKRKIILKYVGIDENNYKIDPMDSPSTDKYIKALYEEVPDHLKLEVDWLRKLYEDYIKNV